MKSVDQEELDSFLARHAPVETQALFHSGDLFGDWRITAFLGRGGSGEVYRVVNAQNGEIAALKVFARKPDADDGVTVVAKARFLSTPIR